MTLLEHLEDEQKWLRDRMAIVTRMIVEMKGGKAQSVGAGASITPAVNVVEVTYTQRGE
jgi:hypothetical protein